VNEYGWVGAISISAASQAELGFLLLHLPSFEGCPIPTSQAVPQVYELQEVLDRTEAILHSGADVPNLLVSDASQTGAFIYLADGSFSYVADFQSEQATASSSYRELLALYHALHNDSHVFTNKAARLIYWQTDNQACVRFISTGSRHPHIQRLVFSIKQQEKNLRIRIIPVWTPRSHPRIIFAEAGSRFATSTDEWFLNRFTLNVIFQHMSFQPSHDCVDCFASTANKVSSVFYSVIPQQGSAGVDFFSQNPTQKNLYLCPPVSMVPRAFRRILQIPNKRCLLIVPR
jgi:hypothetical protein